MPGDLYKLPILYKAKSSGAIQQWEVWAEDATIYTRFGEVGGKLQETADVIREGKNLGRSNETSPEVQARLEAESKWDKMRKKGYVEDLERAAKEENDLEGIAPMLAHKFSEHGDKIRFPAAVQPKLDGLRCLTRSDSTLWSRTQKPITSVPHIGDAVSSLFEVAPPLDGELYNHDFRDNFEKIVSIVRQTKKVDPEHGLVQYWVYDVALPDLPFKDRLEFLENALGHESTGPILLVPTFIVQDEEELMQRFQEFRAEGYEGAMVRNLDGLYEQKRSVNLQKVKEFDDAEFRIVGVQEGRGKMAGKAIFTCHTDGGIPFEVKLKGDLDHLSEYLRDETTWKGKLLTVQFQGFTGKNKVPRFPVGLRIRAEGL